jgi:hypothetical protein
MLWYPFNLKEQLFKRISKELRERYTSVAYIMCTINEDDIDTSILDDFPHCKAQHIIVEKINATQLDFSSSSTK